MSIIHCISLPRAWEQQEIFTFNRPWAALLQHNWWRKDRSVTLAFWISLHFYGWMSQLSHLFNADFFFPLYHSHFYFHFANLSLASYPSLTTWVLISSDSVLYIHYIFFFFNNIDQSWLSKVFKYVPNFKFSNRECKVSGSHHRLNFDMCSIALLYWVFLCIKNLLLRQHLSLKAFSDLLNWSLSEIGE